MGAHIALLLKPFYYDEKNREAPRGHIPFKHLTSELQYPFLAVMNTVLFIKIP
jgi:hypothetical protein